MQRAAGSKVAAPLILNVSFLSVMDTSGSRAHPSCTGHEGESVPTAQAVQIVYKCTLVVVWNSPPRAYAHTPLLMQEAQMHVLQYHL